MRAWIEILYEPVIIFWFLVALFMRAWIEICAERSKRTSRMSPSS